jgi:hypothetical protein
MREEARLAMERSGPIYANCRGGRGGPLRLLRVFASTRVQACRCNRFCGTRRGCMEGGVGPFGQRHVRRYLTRGGGARRGGGHAGALRGEACEGRRRVPSAHSEALRRATPTYLPVSVVCCSTIGTPLRRRRSRVTSATSAPEVRHMGLCHICAGTAVSALGSAGGVFFPWRSFALATRRQTPCARANLRAAQRSTVIAVKCQAAECAECVQSGEGACRRDGSGAGGGGGRGKTAARGGRAGRWPSAARL